MSVKTVCYKCCIAANLVICEACILIACNRHLCDSIIPLRRILANKAGVTPSCFIEVPIPKHGK